MTLQDRLIRSGSVAVVFLALAARATAQAPEYTVSDMGRSAAPTTPPNVYNCATPVPPYTCPTIQTITNGTAFVFSVRPSPFAPDGYLPYYWEPGMAQAVPAGISTQDTGRAVAMSSNGFVVGDVNGGVNRAFRWSRSTGLLALDYPDRAYALGVNAAGLVVGQVSINAQIRAVMWNNSPTPIFLDDLTIVGKANWQFESAQVIADSGVIAGIGKFTNSAGTTEEHNFLLTPSGGGSGAMNRSTWTVIATESSPSDPPSNAIDGNLNTRFSTGRAQHDSQGFFVNWNGDVTIGRIRMEVGPSTNDYPRTCGIWVKDTAGNVTSVACVPDANGNVDAAFTPVPASTIEVWQWGTASSWWSIAEFNVYKQ